MMPSRGGALLTMLALMLLVLAGTPARGQEQIFPFPVSVFELGNGLKVVGVDYDSPGIVAYYTVVRTGSRKKPRSETLRARSR